MNRYAANERYLNTPLENKEPALEKAGFRYIILVYTREWKDLPYSATRPAVLLAAGQGVAAKIAAPFHAAAEKGSPEGQVPLALSA